MSDDAKPGLDAEEVRWQLRQYDDGNPVFVEVGGKLLPVIGVTHKPGVEGVVLITGT